MTGPPSRIVLVGFMAAGKTTVGRRLADRLGYRFVDLDDEVVRRAGRSIAAIFREEGESAFRRLEAEATGALDAAAGLVVAVGGGWMARPELRDRWPDAVRVWLRVGAAEAVARLEGGLAGRPLLATEDPERAARRLLAEREEAYALAELSVETEGRDPDDVAAEVLRRLPPAAEPGTGRPLTSRSRKAESGEDPSQERRG